MFRDELAQDGRMLASEAFNRCWHFLENDPVLAGEDRQDMQEKLAKHIQQSISTGERNLLFIANKAIRTLRQQYARRRERLVAEETA